MRPEINEWTLLASPVRFANCAIVIVIVAVLLSACSRSAEDPGGQQLPATLAEPDLAALMGELHRHSMKLGYSIDAKNHDLSRFYVHELGEVIDSLESIDRHDDLPIGSTARTIMRPLIAPLSRSIEQKDWAASEASYRTLIEGCNRCHVATEHEFVVILPAQGNPPFNQKFSSDRDES